MSDKYQNKYRIPSSRLQNWDYGNNGSYFITICTKNREHFFGKIVDKKMQLNEIGIIGQQFWAEIPIHFPFIELGNFVIMPNHTHGILIIDKSVAQTRLIADPDQAQTRLIASLPVSSNNPGGITGNKNPMFHENISRIIRWYKGRCTFEIKKIHADFAWQPRFHDHIIRNTPSFERIQNYIANNPLRWKEDKFYENNNKSYET